VTAAPIDRVHFLDEQRRNRRRSLRFSIFAVIAVALSGIPLCVIVAPLLLGAVLVVAHVVDLLSPLSPQIWDTLHDVAFALPDVWAAIRGRPTDIDWRVLALVYATPGAVLMLLSWPFTQIISRRAGAGTMLQRLPSRELDLAVLAERQLNNVVDEMAIAAGIQPPAVRLIDSPAVNAVAVGLGTNDAVILATSGFLKRLDRDERQAIVAHLVGSVGNGDLEIGAVILSVFATWGLVALLLETPLDTRRWRLVGRYLRLSAGALRGRADSAECRAMFDELLRGAAADVEMIDRIYDIEPRSPLHGCVIMVIHLPLLVVLGLSSITAKLAISLFTAIGLGPWLAAMWRARRRLADASAIQLTRNPTALANAVQTLNQSDVVVPGGWVAYFLFPVWAGVTAQNADQPEVAAHIIGMRLEAEPRLERIAALGALFEAPVVKAGLPSRLRRLGTWKDFWTALAWGLLALVMCAFLISVTLALASLVLMALWYALAWVNPRR
jgi:Zn-dependent protease with chaperone function